jgi:thioredoxin reductase
MASEAGGGEERYDAVVVGGGPAGLAGALWLARYRARVRLFDEGDPRNAPAWGVHGYLGLDDPPPMELRRIGREQASRAGAELEAASVQRIEGEEDDFRVVLGDGRVVGARRVLLATGLRDIIPEVPGLWDFYGRSIWHCPDCDGPSVTGKRVGIIGWGEGIARFCMWMLTWTDRLVVLTHSHPDDMSPAARAHLERFGIRVRHEALVGIEGTRGCVERVRFHDGTSEELDAVFFHIAVGSGSGLAAELGCALAEGGEAEGLLQVDANFQTSVPGVYAAGDITPGSRLAIRAAWEGTRAAVGIKKSLIPAECRW